MVNNIKAVDRLLTKIHSSKVNADNHDAMSSRMSNERRQQSTEVNGTSLDALRRDYQQRHRAMYKYLAYAKGNNAPTISEGNSSLREVVEYLANK